VPERRGVAPRGLGGSDGLQVREQHRQLTGQVLLGHRPRRPPTRAAACRCPRRAHSGEAPGASLLLVLQQATFALRNAPSAKIGGCEPRFRRWRW
jgi:hypothetical protein